MSDILVGRVEFGSNNDKNNDKKKPQVVKMRVNIDDGTYKKLESMRQSRGLPSIASMVKVLVLEAYNSGVRI